MTATAGHVFISHGSDDRDAANALSAFIEARGIKTWIAPRDVRPGQDYSEQLQLALEQCAAFVVLVTEKANSSPYVRAETEMAFSNSKPIFPVRQSDIQPAAGLAFFLKIRHWTDAFGKDGDAAMERLGQELDRVCGGAKAEIAAEPEPEPAPVPMIPPAGDPAMPTSPPALFTPLPEAQPTIRPTAAAVAPTPPLSTEQEERLTAAIGPNAPLYLEKWRRMDTGGSSLSWNWPAFLANIFWLAYRRMWLPLAVGIVLFFLTDLVVSRNRGLVAPGWLFLLLLALLCGAMGNALYRRQVKALVAKADGLDQPVALAQIRAQGGVSVPGLVSTLAVFALLFIAAAVAQKNKPVDPATPVQPGQQATGNAPAPAEQPAPNPPPAEQPAPAAAGLDPSYLVGRWSSDGGTDCNSSFNNDGTFTASDGKTGYWRLDGDRLTLTGTSTLVLQVSAIDQNTMTLVNSDGSLIRATRC